MFPFDFLKHIANGYNQVKSTIEQYFPSQTANFRLDKSPNAPTLNIPKPAQAAEPTPQVNSRPTAADSQTGFSKFGNGGAPIATQSAQFAEAGNRLPTNIDALLPAIIALMETGGGQRQVGTNNPFNIRGIQDGTTKFINYSSPGVALLGGDNNGIQSKGFIGQILSNPAYSDFRASGDLADFFKVYTPPGPQYGNPSLDELISRYQTLRSLFPNVEGNN